MTTKKKQQQHSDPFGDIFLPVFELVTILCEKLIEGLIKLVQLLFMEVVFKDRKKQILKKIERKDIDCKKLTNLDSSFGYSVTYRRDINISDIDSRAHSAIVGASGTGKTSLIDSLILGDLQRNKSVIYIDPKSTRAGLEQFVNLCLYSDSRCKLFSNFYKGENRLYINPVKSGTTTQIADRIYKSFTWSEEFYALKCYQALRVSIEELKTENEFISLKTIYQRVLLIADSKFRKHISIKRSEVDGIITRLENINKSDFGELLNHEEGLSFKELRDKNINAYIGISVLGYPEIARSVGKILLGDIATSVNDVYEKTGVADAINLKPMSLKIDELGAIVLDEFIEILNKCRGAKLEVTVAMQSPNDISKVCPDLTQQIFENTSNWFIMRQRMKDSASMLSESIGTMESLKQTIRIDDGEEQAQGSQRKVEELIVHSSIIKSLKTGQCILMRQNPFKVDLVNVKYIDPLVVLKNLKLINKEPTPIQNKQSSPKRKELIRRSEFDS